MWNVCIQEQEIQKAKERLAEKNRRDLVRLQQLEKKKEQERLEKKRFVKHTYLHNILH